MAELRTRPLYSYRDDPAVPRFDDRGPVAIMDGNCALCAGGARAIARFDRERVFRIGRTQSTLGAALVRHYGLEPEDPETWLYLEDGRAWSGMEAIIRIGARLGGPGRLLGVMRVFPRPATGVALPAHRAQPLLVRPHRHVHAARRRAAGQAARVSSRLAEMATPDGGT